MESTKRSKMAQEFDDKDKDIEKYIVAFLGEYKKKNTNVLFNIMRSKNKNTVVYGLNMKDGKLDENVVRYYYCTALSSLSPFSFFLSLSLSFVNRRCPVSVSFV